MIAAVDIKWERIGVLSAFVALLLSVVGFAVAPIPPSIGTSTEEITPLQCSTRSGTRSPRRMRRRRVPSG